MHHFKQKTVLGLPRFHHFEEATSCHIPLLLPNFTTVFAPVVSICLSQRTPVSVVRPSGQVSVMYSCCILVNCYIWNWQIRLFLPTSWLSLAISFDRPRQQWSLLNRFSTQQGHCGASVPLRGETWTISHIVM